MRHERLGTILTKQGIINQQSLDFCLNVQRNNGNEPIGRVLKFYDFIQEEHIAQALSVQSGWPLFQGPYIIDQDILNTLGYDFCVAHFILPCVTNQGTVIVVSRINDTQMTDAIQSRLPVQVNFMIGCECLIRRAFEQRRLDKDSVDVERIEQINEEHISDWVEQCFNHAAAVGATDIHIEPSAKAVEIRLRIDGILHFYRSLRLHLLPRLVNIIFHKADVSISDFTHVHDARFSYQYLNRGMDVRVSHIPSIHGSSLVLRLLDKGKASVPLTHLGYGPGLWDAVAQGLMKPEGITLIVGPTGSGKTTSLYAMLNHLKSIGKKIVTVEDPVEVHMPLMMQVQTNEKRDLTFSHCVRSFLRHDPNIILVGEIRDEHTAQEAMRASMTGHKVFATLHANRPLEAILRLHDLGIGYTHLACNITSIITQRLVRKLCPQCKRKLAVNNAVIKTVEQKYISGHCQSVFVPVGCSQCHLGYKGRTVVAEVMNINEDLAMALGQGKIISIPSILKDQKYQTMTDDAARLISDGVISLDEAVRVLG